MCLLYVSFAGTVQFVHCKPTKKPQVLMTAAIEYTVTQLKISGTAPLFLCSQDGAAVVSEQSLFLSKIVVSDLRKPIDEIIE